MKNTTDEKLKLGVFVIVGLLLFIAAIYLIGQRKNMFTKTFTISANFNNVNGLLQGNNVRYSGINVGTVKRINMINDSTINVIMIIDEKMVTHIKKDAIATIGTDGLVGNMLVNITPGNGNATVISKGDTIKSYSKIGTDDMLNTLNVTNENAALLTAKLLDIANSITNGNGTIGMLINDSITAKNIQKTINNLKLTSIEANRTMGEINELVNALNIDESIAGVLLKDTLETQKVKQVINNLEVSSKNINEVVINLNETLLNIKDGDGAMNYLANDPEFVKNLDKAIKNINNGADKFNKNMEALKHNFLTRGYFRKLERKQKREAKTNME
ncbi:MlaD family protein [Seonamhaeicola aphaedonensis]|uniref:Phospholipid/cholesterol/gamma-HCH transport system substrate-binding protein n=1 Tax=Seonamhaeicola aphaedonensis TaxID=1461338 RepID=A0A3D9HIV1_9FLAO|nr:MlaD family protein [Seonamhaeicola aphaedonensis]RED49378.1 phospholipid/cholesterol/gamma-HCH transport system substrate-binding protein [Seonamhaeicola aphaedonensis]